MVNGVGGSTVHYPGLSARFHRWNFEARSATIARYGAAAIPAGSTLADWPVGYDELEPFYEAVEQAIGVAGDAGTTPFEAERRSGYPAAGPAPQRLDRAHRGRGPLARLAPVRGTRRDQLDPVQRQPGLHLLRVLYRHRLLPGCQGLDRRHGDPPGRGDRPPARRDGGARATHRDRLRRQLPAARPTCRTAASRSPAARAVLLATFTYENTRLLLRSRSAAHPAGIGNAHDQVGRHYMAHVTPFAFGRFPGTALNQWNGSWAQATCIDDWNADAFDHAGLGFIGGGLLTASHELKPIAFARAPLPPGVPRWGTRWKAWLAANARSVGTASGQMECLPYEEHRLDLDPAARDAYGEPVVRVTHRVRENESRGAAFLAERLEQWLRAAGADEVWHGPQPFVEARHCYGGARMGDDPAGSVVDRFGFVHDVPNLGVLGTSVFPSSGGHNPTLTLQALAWRSAQRLVDQLTGCRSRSAQMQYEV